MKDHKLADNQTFKEDEESTTVSFSSSQFDKVLELILSWGRQAEPLAPARLVKRWKEEVLAMAEKVKDQYQYLLNSHKMRTFCFIFIL